MEELVGIVLEDRDYIEVASSFVVDFAIVEVVACDSSVDDDTLVVVHCSSRTSSVVEVVAAAAAVVVVGMAEVLAVDWRPNFECSSFERVNWMMMASERRERVERSIVVGHSMAN